MEVNGGFVVIKFDYWASPFCVQGIPAVLVQRVRSSTVEKKDSREIDYPLNHHKSPFSYGKSHQITTFLYFFHRFLLRQLPEGSW